MPSKSCVVDGWRSRQKKAWFPTSGFADIGVSPGNTLYWASNPGGSNKYTLCLRIKTPNDANISSISKISVSFRMYEDNGTSATLYGSLRTTYTDSNTSDTASTYRTNSIGSEASASHNSTSYKTFTFSFSGTFSKNTYYYLFLYTKSNSDIFCTLKGDLQPSATCEYTLPTYTVSYNANGGSGTTASQTVTQGSSVTLRSNSFTAPSGVLYKITLYGNGGKDGTPKYNGNGFSNWRLNSASGTSYNPGDSFTPTANTTFYAKWYMGTTLGTTTRDSDTVDGYVVTLNPNGGTSSTSSVTAKNTVTYIFNGWDYSATSTRGGWNATSNYAMTSDVTLYAAWDPVTTLGGVFLPTPTYKTNGSLKISLNYQGGTGSTTSVTSTSTTTKTFNGWGTSATATSGAMGAYSPSSNETLYATWKNPVTAYSAVTLPTPTKLGYKFLGWATSANATTNLIPAGSYTPSSSITTLYAIWKADGAIRIYINETQKYEMALPYIYTGQKWELAIPYLYDGSMWKLVGG